MASTATLPRQPVLTARFLGESQLVLGLALLIALALPLLVAKPGPLSSDESLYIAEGLNIAEGKGYTYTNGEAVNHRAPLFPAILALDFKLAGASHENALWVSRAFALGSAALLLALGWRLFGREAGLLAATIALASSLLNLMGSSVFLDGAESFFLLLALLLLHKALMWGGARWAAASGAALGLAFLTKESTLLWVPLPFLAALLLGPAVERPREMLVAYGAGFLAVAGWWWVYVLALTGDIYLLGDPARASIWLVAGALCIALAAIAVPFGVRRGARIHHRGRAIIAGTLLLAWAAFFLIGLERNSTWPFSPDYIRTVPDYVSTTLASWLRPLPLIAAAWGCVAYRAMRGSLGDRLLLLGLLLFLPFALFVANRDLHVRDILPIVYLSYLALARAAIDFARWFAEAAGEALAPAVGGGAAALVVLAGLAWFVMAENDRFADTRSAFNPAVTRQDNWDNPLAQSVASWLERNVDPGTPVMSSRLYYSHVYTLANGSFPVWQLPTVRVAFEGNDHEPARASTLFRWEDHRMPAGTPEPWLYLQRYPLKGYYVGLSERDLLSDIATHQIEYLVITGDDAGFSSLSLLAYFENHPAFTSVASFVANDTNQAHIFHVSDSMLVPIAQPAQVSESTARALKAAYGASEAEAILSGLSSEGYVISGR
jgi:4-amino-4-deoxy-L-arabinose transferase-like glycosyltransferase